MIGENNVSVRLRTAFFLEYVDPMLLNNVLVRLRTAFFKNLLIQCYYDRGKQCFRQIENGVFFRTGA